MDLNPKTLTPDTKAQKHKLWKSVNKKSTATATMGIRGNFSRGKSRHFAYVFQFDGDATQMDVHKKENVRCHGNSSIQCFPC